MNEQLYGLLMSAHKEFAKFLGIALVESYWDIGKTEVNGELVQKHELTLSFRRMRTFPTTEVEWEEDDGGEKEYFSEKKLRIAFKEGEHPTFQEIKNDT